jgi:hypothetical protein
MLEEITPVKKNEQDTEEKEKEVKQKRKYATDEDKFLFFSGFNLFCFLLSILQTMMKTTVFISWFI